MACDAACSRVPRDDWSFLGRGTVGGVAYGACTPSLKLERGKKRHVVLAGKYLPASHYWRVAVHGCAVWG